MSDAKPRRIAILGFSLETNRFAPACGATEFKQRGLYYGDEITEHARREAPVIDSGICGFYKIMDVTGPWQPVPIAHASAHPNGPADQDFFDTFLQSVQIGLQDAGSLDGVYICEHGAGLATEDDDPDGTLFALARKKVGPDVPIIATLDLHANVSETMLANADMLISYRTNPHVDAFERGEEAARAMLEIFDGVTPTMASIRLPLVAPTVTLLTAEGHPYGDIIRQGQAAIDKDILNVSITAGFAFSDTDRNGMTFTVTARGDKSKAVALATKLAKTAWADRERYKTNLTSLSDAIQLAKDAKPAPENLLFCDPADNPGGGGRGNTTYILKAFIDAGIENVLFGVQYDPPLVDAAFKAGEGATIRAVFNTEEDSEFSEQLAIDAIVEKLTEGQFVGTRGMAKGRTVRLGRACLLAIGGIKIAVISVRQQCLSNDYFTHFGVDAAKANCTIVKSRGHFRAGFDHLFPPDRILEVDVPGLTSPNLSNFNWQHLPRPVYPMDPETEWSPPA